MQNIYGISLLVCLLVCLPLVSQTAQPSPGANPSDRGIIRGQSVGFTNAFAEALQQNPLAAGFIKEGIDAFERQDFVRGEECLRRVMSMDPKFFGVHAFLGNMYLEQGRLAEGLAELRKEEDYHSGNADTYQLTSQILLEMNRKDDALVSLRKWVAADPSNLQGAVTLGELLSETKNYSEAVQVMERAYKLGGDSAKLESALAEAYLHNHQTEQGRSLLKKSIRVDASASDLGAAAYILAENNIDLELAHDYAKRALAKSEAESLASTDDDILVVNTLQMGGLWGVMGWVNFRLGDYRAAISYLEAAWLLSQDPDTGDHLAQAYEKLGRKEEAAHTYLLAVASAYGHADDARHRYQALTGKKVGDIHAMVNGHNANGKAATSVAEELSRLRTVNLSKSARNQGNATFTIIFSPGKPTIAKYISGEDSLRTITNLITSAPFKIKYPDPDPVRLVRRGMVVCGTITGCDMVLLLPNSVHDVD